MPSLLGKKFPAPIAQPMWPFYVAGAVIMYGVSGFANLITNADSFDFKTDPRNPNFKKPATNDKH